MSLEHSPNRDSARRLNTAEAAQFIGLSASTLAKLRMKSGYGPRFYKVGRRVIYDEADLTAFLESRARISTSDPGNVARLP